MKSKINIALKMWGLLLLCGLFIAGSLTVPAQEKPKLSSDEAKAAKKIEEAKTLDAKIKAAEEFVKKHPNSSIRRQVAEYVAAQIEKVTDQKQRIDNFETYFSIFFTDEEMALVMPMLIDSYVKVKQHKDAFNLADKYLALQPGDVTIRLMLAVEGSNLARSGGGTNFLPQSRTFAAKAIELIEANNKPADLTDAQWSEYQTRWLPYLYQTLGFIFIAQKNLGDARLKFEKAAALAPAEVNNWAMLGFILNDEYQQMAKLYNVSSPGKERDELLNQINARLDKIIEYFARVVALTDNDPSAKELNAQTRQDLESYYKFRHNNSTQGLKELIDKYKAVK